MTILRALFSEGVYPVFYERSDLRVVSLDCKYIDTLTLGGVNLFRTTFLLLTLAIQVL